MEKFFDFLGNLWNICQSRFWGQRTFEVELWDFHFKIKIPRQKNPTLTFGNVRQTSEVQTITELWIISCQSFCYTASIFRGKKETIHSYCPCNSVSYNANCILGYLKVNFHIFILRAESMPFYVKVISL